ncbi:transglutaminase TgpA family protein [Clavibacter sp. km1a]|uniref:transglutaminase TgpA family protein n=1 Tax=Clavibacter sp. km1a TaxID=3459136 RepID=UPI0040417903
MTDLDAVGLGGREHWAVEPRPLPGERAGGPGARRRDEDGSGAGGGRRTPGAGRAAARWPLTAALGAALLAAAASLHLLVEPGPWFVICVVLVAAVLGSAALLRAAGVPRLLASAGGLVVLVLLVTLVFAGGTAVLGVIPTPETLRTLVAVGQQAGEEIYRRSAPVPPIASIVFVVVASVGALAVVLDVLAHALRLPAVTGLPLLVLVSVPGAVLVGEFSLASFAVTVLAWFAVLAADARDADREGGWRGSGLLGGPRPDPVPRARSSSGRAAASARTALASAGALAGGAVVLSLVVPAIVPGLTSATFPAASGSGAGGSRVVNPILDLGDDLRRPVDVEALRYTTESPTALYFKVTTLSRFEGEEWAPSPLRPPDGNTVDAIGPDLGAGSDVPVEDVETRVQVEGSSSAWLPVPYAPRSVDGLEGSWRWSEQGLAIRSSDSDSRRQSYTVRSELPRPTREQLEDVAPVTDDELRPFLQIPDGTPDVIASTTADVLAGLDAPYDQAIALQEFFRGGEFLYSEEAPVQQGYDGSGVDVVGEFLRVRSGYCVHFASAMAIMAREAGIPSRVAVGYLPGDQVARDGDLITYRVGSHDLHSWPELYFAGVGWIAFEPTPGRGQAAPYAQPSAAPTAAPTPSASPTAAAEPTATATPVPTASAAPGASGATAVRIPWAALGTAALVLLVLALLATPALIRRARRRGRLRALEAGDAPAGTAWREAEDRAVDLGIRVPDTESPRELGRRLADDDASLADPVALLVGVRERERFARAGVPVDRASGAAQAGALVALGDALRVRAGRLDRVLALVAPRSLVRRRPRGDDEAVGTGAEATAAGRPTSDAPRTLGG